MHSATAATVLGLGIGLCLVIGLVSEGHVHPPVSLAGALAGLFHTPLAASSSSIHAGRPFHLRAAYEGAARGAWTLTSTGIEGPTTHWHVKLASWIPPALVEAASFASDVRLVHRGRVAPDVGHNTPLGLWHSFALVHPGSSSQARVPLVDLTLMPLVDDVLGNIPGILAYENDVDRTPGKMRALTTDPQVVNGESWHLRNNGTLPQAVAGVDINVVEAWNEGFKGEGIVVVVSDNGLECLDETDYKCDEEASYDFLRGQVGVQPGENNHGTACAGLVGGRESNGLCSVGVAPASTVVPYDLGTISPPSNTIMAPLMTRNIEDIAVHSNSWGPTDNGLIMYTPDQMVSDSIWTGVLTGRGGLGTVYTWAGGNGLFNGDRSDYDGLASLPYSINVGAISIADVVTSYAEDGASLLVVAPSDDLLNNLMDQVGGIATTYPQGVCAVDFGGTSASCPIVAGVAALVLEANPKLSYLDVQDIFVQTSRQDIGLTTPGLAVPGDWRETGLPGRNVSHFFGWGMVDAGAAVKAATSRNDPPGYLQNPVKVEELNDLNDALPADGDGPSLSKKVTVPSAKDMSLTYITHVKLTVSISTPDRGGIVIRMYSPAGHETVFKLPNDPDDGATMDMAFFSARHWREDPKGEWEVKFDNVDASSTHTLKEFKLEFLGAGPTQPKFINWVLIGAVVGGSVLAIGGAMFFLSRRKSGSEDQYASATSNKVGGTLVGGTLNNMNSGVGYGGDEEMMTQATEMPRTRSRGNSRGSKGSRSRSRGKSRSSGGGRRRSRSSGGGGRSRGNSNSGSRRM